MQVRNSPHFLYVALMLVSLLACQYPKAHPMPSTLVNLYVMEQSIKGEARVPIVELENAIGKQDFVNLNNEFLKKYFLKHISATSDQTAWQTIINSLSVMNGTDSIVGGYRELVVAFELKPNDITHLREFYFNYTAVLHQVVTHKAMVYVQDWYAGIKGEDNNQEVGIIGLDVPSGKVYPLKISLEKGSWWKGFSSMFKLGMLHIKEGTDHLLFLLVLLLPSMLLTNGKSWGGFGGIKYSVVSLLKIVTAFTIGHSITLLFGALGWVRLPQQPVEILIAVSILVSAIHAIKPSFVGKETYVAAGFGLVHGMAFATVLSSLKLTTSTLALSVLGFNIGIEVMQLIVIVCIVPWLMLISNTGIYKVVRIVGAILAGIAALGWIAERASGRSNLITNILVSITSYDMFIIAGIALTSLLVFICNTIAVAFANKK